MNNLPDQLDAPDRAFVLTGAFWVICRNPLYLNELRRRGLKILVITPSSYRHSAQAARGDSRHPASMIDDIAYVDGALDSEGSFTAGVIAAAQAWRARFDLVGVYAIGETLVEPTGLVGDALGLATPGLRATRTCRSKYLQRWYLPDLSPQVTVVPPGGRESLERSAISLPAVVKPATRHSSSGVQTVDDWERLQTEVTTYPPHETLLIEEKVIGQEFSVESLVQERNTVFASVTRKETTESHSRSFVELSHTVPEQAGPVADTILAANRLLLDKLAFENGIVHSEWRFRDGVPVLMEVAARTPGDGLLVLYQLATGVPLEPEIVRVALRETASYPEPTRYARQVYLEHRSGILQDVILNWPGVEVSWLTDGGLWPEIKPGAPDGPGDLRAVFVLKARGAELGPLLSSDDRAVCFFIDAPSLPELESLEQRVRAALTVRVSLPAARPSQ